LELIERNVRSDVVKYLNVACNYLVGFFCLYVGGREGAWMKDFVKIVRKNFRGEEIDRCIPKNVRISCNIYPGICLLIGDGPSEDRIAQLGIKPLFVGRVVGVIFEEEIYPSPWLLEDLYRCTGKIRSAIEAIQQGVKAFLYGNDLLVASVNKIHGPFKKGDIIAIIDPVDGRVIGVARAAMNPGEIERARSIGRLVDVAAKNILDLGWFLRVLKPVEDWD
jgi:ribosome biogenesis protein Nip4